MSTSPGGNLQIDVGYGDGQLAYIELTVDELDALIDDLKKRLRWER